MLSRAARLRRLPQPRPNALSRPALIVVLASAGACLQPHPALAGCAIAPVGDVDCDGVADALDPCPTDTLNHCNGPVALCATAPAGVQDCIAGDELRLDLGAAGPTTDCNLDTWNVDSGAGSTSTVAFAIPAAPVQNAFGCTDTATESIVAAERFGTQISRSYPIANGV